MPTSIDPPWGTKIWRCGNCEPRPTMKLANYVCCTNCQQRYDVYTTWYDPFGHVIELEDGYYESTPSKDTKRPPPTPPKPPTKSSKTTPSSATKRPLPTPKPPTKSSKTTPSSITKRPLPTSKPPTKSSKAEPTSVDRNSIKEIKQIISDTGEVEAPPPSRKPAKRPHGTDEEETPQLSRKSARLAHASRKKESELEPRENASSRTSIDDTTDNLEGESTTSSPNVGFHQDTTSVHGSYSTIDQSTVPETSFTGPNEFTSRSEGSESVSDRRFSSPSFPYRGGPRAFVPDSEDNLTGRFSKEPSDPIRQQVPMSQALQYAANPSQSDYGLQQNTPGHRSDFSTSFTNRQLSLSFYGSDYGVGPVLEEVHSIFMGDLHLQNLLLRAFRQREASEAVKTGVHLLRWLGRRLDLDAQSPTEQEIARLFQKRRFGCAVMDRFAEMEGLDRGWRTRDIETKLKTGRSSGSEDEGQMLNGTFRFEIGTLRAFIESSDAFVRFKEELEDLTIGYPFKNETMWEKFLWDGEEQVRFEHSGSVPRLTRSEQIKLKVEEIPGIPILWWPLKQPRKCLSENMIRIIWMCACKHETYIDISLTEARNYRQRCSTYPPRALPNQSPTLPTHNPVLASTSGSGETEASSTLLDRTISNVRKRLPTGRKNASPDEDSEAAATAAPEATTSPKYMHWCVDAISYRTILHSICMREKQGQAFINELYRSYKSIRGWHWYLSMTTCTEINLVRHFNVHDTEEKVVICDCKDVLPTLNDSSEYVYQIYPPDLDKEIHVRRAERTLTDYYHGNQPCCAIDRFTQVMEGVPHRITRKKLGMKGYGIWARQGWTLLRLMAFVLITQGWAVIFATYWLCTHPGDLQNAFAPGGYSLGLVAVFIALPDVFLSRRQ